MGDETRLEHDSLGPVQVPVWALWGAQTQRAVDNFPISGRRFSRHFIGSLGLVKRACAIANHALGDLSTDQFEAIQTAATEVLQGRLDEHFPLDIFQTGSGTSTNMNANEVIAHRAAQLAVVVHPNDHVNRSQSSNDVIPTTLHVAAATALHNDLVPALTALADALEERGEAFKAVVKSGRTHGMDATPVTLGQEFRGWASQVRHGIRRAEGARDALMELALGGTAVGTGLNRRVGFPLIAIGHISAHTGLPFVEAADHFEAQGGRDAAVEAHGLLCAVATALTKVANDIRLLATGPRTGLGELILPAVQPGSSIMPGKVNPVMSEMLTMVCARVLGNQTTVTIAGFAGVLELNTYIPVIADALLESIEVLSNGASAFASRTVAGIEADAQVARATVDRNLSLATALAPTLGYDRAAALAKQAHQTGQTIREVASEAGLLSESQLDRLLDPAQMIGPDDDPTR